MLFYITGRCYGCQSLCYKTKLYNNYKYSECTYCKIRIRLCDECIDEEIYRELDIEHLDNCLNG